MQIDIMNLRFIHKTLGDILLWLEQETGQIYVIKSLYRIGDIGIHGTLPLRAIDISCRNRKIGEQIEGFINKFWQYDPTRPDYKCAILHGENLHLHLQVHDNTIFKNET